MSLQCPDIPAKGRPRAQDHLSGSVAGSYLVRLVSFGPALSSPVVTAEVMPVLDTAPNLGLACTPLSAANAAAVNGKIAVLKASLAGHVCHPGNQSGPLRRSGHFRSRLDVRSQSIPERFLGFALGYQCFPNQVMEPAINGDLTHEVTPRLI
jgi:hypothetical protein